jgi:hypothetical protein
MEPLASLGPRAAGDSHGSSPGAEQRSNAQSVGPLLPQTEHEGSHLVNNVRGDHTLSRLRRHRPRFD